MVMSFFRGDGGGGVTESVDRQIAEMLGACRHSFDLAMSALVADDNITAIGDDVHDTDDQVNELEETVRRELVVHAAVHGQTDMSLTMPSLLVVKRLERVGDQCKNIFGMANQGVRFTNAPDRTLFDEDRRVISAMFGTTTEVMASRDPDAVEAFSAEAEALMAELEDRVTQRTQAYRETAAKLAATLEVSRFQSRNYGMLQEMADMLQSCTSPFEAARVAGEFAVNLFDADAGTVYALDQESGSFNTLHTWGTPSESTEQVIIDDCWALRQNKPYPNSVHQFALRCNHLRLIPSRNAFCLPMHAHGQITGLINLRRTAPFVSQDVEASAELEKVAQLFTANIAQFLSNLALRRKLEQQSLRDPLTNLFNRRYFNEQLAIEFERANRSRTPLALQMVDIDHFKRINDRFGHEAGDRVLRQVSDILAQNARAGDIVCRWGGEEFLILMPGSNAAAAKRRADEIRARINDQIEIVGGTRVSVSIGVASYPEHASDPDSLIDVSDRALYAAKGAGRNRVTVAVAVL